MKRKIAINTLPWFKLWTGYFRSKTDHLSNAEVGGYIRLLASYWDNGGLPFDDKALTRIAKIEPGDDVDLGTLLGEFFQVQDGSLRHEYLDALRVEAIGEEDANRLRTASARAKLAKQRRSVTIPVTETEVEVDIEVEREEDPELEADLQADERFKNQTNTQTEDRDGNSETNVNANSLAPAPPAGDFLPAGGDCLPAGDSGGQTSVQRATGSYQQSASLKPDGGAQGGAVPAAMSAEQVPFTPEQIAEIDRYPIRSPERWAAIKKFSQAA